MTRKKVGTIEYGTDYTYYGTYDTTLYEFTVLCPAVIINSLLSRGFSTPKFPKSRNSPRCGERRARK